MTRTYKKKFTGKKGIVIHNGQIVKLVQRDTPTTGNPPSTNRVNISPTSAPH